MTAEWDEEDDDEGDGWSMPPFDENGVRLLADKCSTCIFRPDNLMRLEPGRVGSMLADVKREDTYVTCHKTLGTGGPGAICRGSNDAHEGQLMRMARAMGWFQEVSEADL